MTFKFAEVGHLLFTAVGTIPHARFRSHILSFTVLTHRRASGASLTFNRNRKWPSNNENTRLEDRKGTPSPDVQCDLVILSEAFCQTSWGPFIS